MYDTIIVKYVSNIDVSRRSGLIYYRIKNNKKNLFIIYIYIIYTICVVCLRGIIAGAQRAVLKPTNVQK